MGDNPMYWPGHQRPPWHQQASSAAGPTGQPVNPMGHYMGAGNMINAVDPIAAQQIQMQSSIQPGARHSQQQLQQQQQQQSLQQNQQATGLYSNMMTNSSAGPRGPSSQLLTSNSHLNAAPSASGIPPHPSTIMQPSPHPQSHYPHQYSSLPTSYWNPQPQPSAGSTPGQPAAPTQSDTTSNQYHSTATASPLSMPNDSRSNLPANSSIQQQQTASAFRGTGSGVEELQPPLSNTHMMAYDRQRGATSSSAQMAQQQHQTPQHPSAMISQDLPGASNNLASPTQSQLSMQGRIQSQQSQLDPMKGPTLSQQQHQPPPQPSAAVPSWSASYYAQPSHSPYSSVMNPYIPYGSSSTVSNHNQSSTLSQMASNRPQMGASQKGPTNGSERARAAAASVYPSHSSSIYGQPPPPSAGANANYYGYDSYYNQMTNQSNTDPYLTHPTSAASAAAAAAAAASQHWPPPPSASNSQVIGNTSTAPIPLQPSLRLQTGSSGTALHPQSPSAASTLPSISARPPSQTPDRSPAAQLSTSSYPSPNQQGATSKSTSSSLAQLEQMVMPGSNANTIQPMKSPTQRSSTNSPSTSVASNNTQQQQQLQYSYNSSGQGSYFSSTSGATNQAAGYYSSYDPSNIDIQKSSWADPSTSPMGPMGPHSSGSTMIDNSQSAYAQQSTYDGSGNYAEYTPLTGPGNSCEPPNRFSVGGESTMSTDKSDPYAIDSQTFDDFDDQTASKSRKSRAKKGEEKVKKERKPRAPKTPKAGSAAPQPTSPAAALQHMPNKQSPSLSQTPEMSPLANNNQPMPVVGPYLSPTHQQVTSIKTNAITDRPSQYDSLAGINRSTTPSYRSPAHRLSTESPTAQTSLQHTTYSASGQPNYYTTPSPSSQTPDKSPAPHGSSVAFSSPNHQGSPSKLTPAIPPQTEPNFSSSSNISVTPVKSPVLNSAISNQPTSYYSSYEPSNIDIHKSGWTDPSSTSPMAPNSSGSTMLDNSESAYGQQTNYEGSANYAEYTPLTGPGNSCDPSKFSMSGVEPLSQDTNESQTIESQTFENSDNQSAPKPRKSRAKKGEEKVKKERKPRAPKTPKAGSAAPQSTSPVASLQQSGYKQSSSLSQTPDMSPHNNQNMSMGEPYTSPHQQNPPVKAASTLDIPGHYDSTTGQSSLQQTPFSTSDQQNNYTTPSPSSQNLDRTLAPNTSESSFPIQDEGSSAVTPNNSLQMESISGTNSTLNTEMPPCKSRAKKNDKKPKRERKSRAKAPPAASTVPAEVLEEVPEPEQQLNEESLSVPADDQSNLESPAKPKPKRIRIRDPSSKGKKKLPKFALKFAKTKKRKRLGSSDNDQSDLDKTPPPSPTEEESGVQKRRSARNTKKLKYNDDIALGFSDSDDDSQILPKSKKQLASSSALDGDNSTVDESIVADEPTVFAAPVEDTMVVEKIMSSRIGKRELEPEPGEVLPPDGTFIDVEEFYVKYKNLSYLHCDWRTLEELERGDRRVAQKVKRYKQKRDSSNLFSFMDEDLFDPQYCEVDRILAVNEVEEIVADSDDEEKRTKADPQKEVESTTNLSAETPKVEINSLDKTCNVEEELTEATATSDVKTDLENNSTADISESNAKPSTNSSSDEKPLAQADSNNIASITEESKPPVEELKQDCKIEKVKKISRHYLVKWRGLSYEESTWELEDDLDPEKIKQFERFKDLPPKSKWKQVKRPKPEEWVRKEVSPVYKNNNTLREYQLEGINWLSFCWHQGRNCILADEMGLGKTIQSIAFVNEIYQHGINGPFLIIVPLSTVGNWAREFETWTDLNTITYHGSSTSREMLKEYEMFYRNEQGNRVTNYYKFQVMITTFEIILSDCLDLREIPWRCCIIDEAHRLKNRNCKLLEGLRLLNMEHRVLLTGTPLQNNVEELFSLLNFLEPTQFSSTEQFLQEFGDLKTEAQVDKLKVILKPMMLRRLKEDVEKTLAPKEETIVEVELTNIQKKYYRAILEKNFSFLTKGGTSNNMPNLMNTMMELRKCCIHPYLINGAEEQILYEAKQAKMSGGEPMSSFQALVNSSGKLVLIDKLLPRLRADGHRVLIFSQMVRCLDILEDYVTHKHYPFERIDGRVRGSDRQQAIDRFSKPGSDRFVFLLCTRAGGLGINLTAADTVIIFDSDWNPQNDLQAQARCHRIGQSKAVKIYRLICRNTYEREMFDKASLKLGLDKAVLQSINAQKTGSGGLDGQLTKKEIEELLRKGAYGALMDDDNAGDKFCEEDIDQILQRRTQVITIDNSEAKGSTFSKATFSSSNNREDIELDDPNFWEKWAKKANIDSDDTRKDELIQLAPRRRTQTKRYGADGNLLDMSDLESSEEDEETISMRTRGQRVGRQQKITPISGLKRSKRNRPFDFEDDEYLSAIDGGFWSKGDCLKVEKGLLTYGWGRWNEIISSSQFRKELTVEECESISRVILLYCLHSYKGDEKIKSFAWDLIRPDDETKSQSDIDSSTSDRGRSSKLPPPPVLMKKSVAEELAEADWPKEAKHDPLISLPDDQYRRHLQRNCNRLLIRVKFLHYLKNDILKPYLDRIHSDCNISEIDLPSIPVDGDLPAQWWDDEADKSLLVGIYKHGHDRFSSMRQDPCLCFLSRCGPPNKKELLAEMNSAERNDDIEDENRDSLTSGPKDLTKPPEKTEADSDAGKLLENLLDNVMKEFTATEGPAEDSSEILDENKNNILKDPSSQNSMNDSSDNVAEERIQTNKMDITTDDESINNEISMDTSDIANGEKNGTGDFSLFPSASDLNQRFRRLITGYQRNFKKLEIKLAQKARDELKKERTSKFEAAKNEREERKRFLAQKWSRREEADFFRAISSFGVEYDPVQKKHDWNKFRSIGKLDKKLDETLEEYYKAFIVMCKRVLSKPLDHKEEKCSLNVDTITEERASRCLSRIEFLNKIREQIIIHPELETRLMLCHPQSELPDWWENGIHDRDLLLAAAKHGLTRLDYNLAFDPTLSFDSIIKQKSLAILSQTPTPILIPIEQLQELLEKNNLKYLKDFSFDKEEDNVSAALNSIIDSIENETNEEGSIRDSEEILDGSLLGSNRVPSKSTRSSSSRLTSGTTSGQVANTIARSGGSNDSITLTSRETRLKSNDSRTVEITPILPNELPHDISKTFEAGEVSITLMSKSALLKLDDREPIVLLDALNPITAKIRWPKDKAIQTRLENLVHLVENNEWPSPPRSIVPTMVPTITLPNHLSTSINSLNVSTSPSKNDKLDMSLGSPKSDISNNNSSTTSKQDSRERSNDMSSKNRRGRGRRPRQPDNDQLPIDMDSFKDERQATAKLRNLLSQGPSSGGSRSSSSNRLDSKFGNTKQDAGFSSLLAPIKQVRSDGSSLNRDDKNLLDPNAATNLIPQILANMKPEFRDLLANQDAATILLNSLSGMSGNLASSLRSLTGSQLSLDNLMNPPPPPLAPPRNSSRSGPPPAHSQPSGSNREMRRSSHTTRENSPPSFNLRSTRGKGCINLDALNNSKSSDYASMKMSSGRKKTKTSLDPPSASPLGPDVLDLSSLPGLGKSSTPVPVPGKSSTSRLDSRSRRHRDASEELSHTSSRSSLNQSSNKSTHKSKSSPDDELQGEGVRTTRASKRIGSRIDALALNLQAKRLNRGDSLTSDLSPSLPKENPTIAHGSSKSSSDSKSHSSKGPPAAHSSSQKHSSIQSTEKSKEKSSNPSLPPNLNQQSSSSSSSLRADPFAQLMSNPSALLPNLNQFSSLNSLGGLLNFPGMSELMKQMTNFPGLAANLPGLSANLPRVSAAPLISNTTTNPTITSNSCEKSNRRSRQSTGTSSAASMAPSSVSSQHQATNAALASSLMNLATQPTSTSNPYANYTSPLTNPFLPFGLAGLGMNNPLGMSLFPNLYMPSGFPNAAQQQPQQPNQTNGPSEDASKDKKMRYPRK